MTKVSVAMTTYNGERYVCKQLQSILNQTRKVDEVVICDDKSTDTTVEKIEDYIKKNRLNNWTLVVNDNNVGYIENFYKAISLTTGDVIFLSDQDDVWYADKVAKMTGLFEKNENIRILNTGFDKIDKDEKPVTSKRRLFHSNNNLIVGGMAPFTLKRFNFDYIIWRNISPGCTAAFDKTCKAMFLDNCTRQCPHDWELNIFGAALGGLYFLNTPLIQYRIHPENTIGLKSLSLAERLKQQNRNDADAKASSLRGKLYADSAWKALLAGKEKKALDTFCRITKRRLSLLEKGRFTDWLLLLRHCLEYLKLRGPRGMIEDMFLAIRKV